MIDENLLGGKVENQYKITLSDGSDRFIDIIYFKQDEITIIELKRESIIKKDVQQLSEYVNHMKNLFPDRKVRGFLAGQQIDENLEYFLNLRGFNFKQYFKDIPFRLKLCDSCRKAVRKSQIECNWCGCQNFIPI